MKLSLLLSAAALAGLGQAAKKPVYKDKNASIDDRVADLLKRMSVKEKMAQLIQGDMTNYLNITDGTVNKTGLKWNMEYRANSVWTGLYTEMETVQKAAKLAQDYLADETELGIPTFVQSEGLHGFLALNATIFNSPIGIGCSFNPGLVEKMGNIIATEALALGVNQLFSPQVDLARELRFGRVEECFGEDPYLYVHTFLRYFHFHPLTRMYRVGEMGYSYAKGLQDKGVSAMVKHFVSQASPLILNLR